MEYALTEKGRALLPIVDGMRVLRRTVAGRSGPRAGRKARGAGRARDRVAATARPPAGRELQDGLRRAAARRSAGRRGRSERRMRSRQLETALTEFVAEAADRLQAEIDGGAEVGFELTEKSARRGESAARLYCYRALTGAFIEERAAKLASLPTHAEARKTAGGLRRPRPLPGEHGRGRGSGTDEGLRPRRCGAEAAAGGRVRGADGFRCSDAASTRSAWRPPWRGSSIRRARARAR